MLRKDVDDIRSDIQELSGNKSSSIYGVGGPYPVKFKTLLPRVSGARLTSIKVTDANGVETERIRLANSSNAFNYTGVDLIPGPDIIKCEKGSFITSITVSVESFIGFNEY